MLLVSLLDPEVALIHSHSKRQTRLGLFSKLLQCIWAIRKHCFTAGRNVVLEQSYGVPQVDPAAILTFLLLLCGVTSWF